MSLRRDLNSGSSSVIIWLTLRLVHPIFSPISDGERPWRRCFLIASRLTRDSQGKVDESPRVLAFQRREVGVRLRLAAIS
jgi:hypothetical protein